MSSLQALRDHLAGIPSGMVAEPGDIPRLLADCWDEFEGSDAEGMGAWKLPRMEDPEWEPPVLSFIIERHGATVCGSSRAEVHAWSVDLDKQTAGCAKVSHRQVRPMQPALKVEPVVNAIVDLIVRGQEDDRLKWYEDGRVKVMIGKILPEGSAFKQTLEGRRKRLREMLTSRLADEGWTKVANLVYQRSSRSQL